MTSDQVTVIDKARVIVTLGEALELLRSISCCIFWGFGEAHLDCGRCLRWKLVEANKWALSQTHCRCREIAGLGGENALFEPSFDFHCQER